MPRSPRNDDPPSLDRLVHVFATSRIPEGLLAKGCLEANGIPVVVKGESEGPYRIGPVYLLVPAPMEARARELLAGTAAEEPVTTDPR